MSETTTDEYADWPSRQIALATVQLLGRLADEIDELRAARG